MNTNKVAQKEITPTSPITVADKPKRKSKKKTLLFLGCILLLLCTISTACIVTLFVLGWKSNKTIPVATKSAEYFEQKLINPQTIAAKVQKTFAQQVVDLLKPATEDDGMSYEEFADEVKNLQSQYELDSNRNPSKTTMDINLTMKNSTMMSQPLVYNIKGEGYYDIENKLAEGNAKVDFGAYGVSAGGDIDFILDPRDEENPVYYVKINNFALLDLLKSSNGPDIMNKWLKISYKDFVDLSDQNGTQVQNQDTNIKLTEEQLNSLEKILENPKLLGNMQWEEAQTFEGKRARCISTSWDKDAVQAIIDDIQNQNLLTDKEIKKGLDDVTKYIDNISVYTCSDRQTGDVYEVKMNLSFTITEDIFGTSASKKSSTEMAFTVDINYSGYGEEHTVTIPDTTENLKDIIDEYSQDSDTSLSFDDSNTYYDVLYYVYTSNSCSECSSIQEYLSDKQLFNVFVFNIDENSFENEEFNQFCKDQNIYNCTTPLLRIRPTNDFSGQDDYIVGSEKILDFLKDLEETSSI